MSLTDTLRFTIYGEMASSKNSRRVAHNRATLKPMLIKSEKAIDWWHSATAQLINLALLLPKGRAAVMFGKLRMTVWAYYATERSDLDTALLKDVLQSRYSGAGKKRRVVVTGVYENDRQVREEHIFHAIDADSPRVVVLLEPL